MPLRKAGQEDRDERYAKSRWFLYGIRAVILAGWASNMAPSYVLAGDNPKGCMSCHEGIEWIRDPSSEMMKKIIALGTEKGDLPGCTICHGGNHNAVEKDAAHAAPFYPDPGSPWVNEQTCGLCHQRHVETQMTSLMMTESGKIQGTVWSFGGMDRQYEHSWGNYDVSNPADPAARIGSEDYRAYMEALAKKEPGAYPKAQEALPEAPTDLSKLHEQPELAAFTYIRSECQRCHLGVKGREKRGDFRGMGCSACHVPYGNEGFYEGGDKSIPHDEPGHMLVHSIQGTREAKVTVHENTYSGVPVETCTTCHDRGKRIGVSFQGLMESAFHSPYTEGGGGQIALHTKHYIAMQEDIHYQKGMMCGDCHTSIDLHGDGFIAGTNLAQVQIECADCHGTPFAYPWELPLGYMDEFAEEPKSGEPRGVATELPEYLKQGTVYDKEDGYLRTARGNPFPEVIRRGDQVVVHTAGGKDIVMDPLKRKYELGMLSKEAEVAMCQIGAHMENMECYACHATWVPQCYGCHLKIDFSEGKKSFDWVAAGQQHLDPRFRADSGESGYDTMIPGEVTEQRSYMRWEDPPLGVSGEGRVAPVTTGCQPSITIIGENGEEIIRNNIYRTPPHTEGGGEQGQLALDMSPGQPHTTGRARSCESCHGSEKALGYGINGGRLTRPWNEPINVEIMSADGQILPKNTRAQIEGIEGLDNDWSRFVTEDGKQLMTVGHHWSGSRPLNQKERTNMDRRGVCLSCHQEIPSESLAVSLLHHTAKYAGTLPNSPEKHDQLVHKILLMAAWTQVGGGALLGGSAMLGLVWWMRRRAWAKAAARGATRKSDN
ncbi:MAG: multiheme c-type cytochrome [Phycisphaerae bacterium]